MVDIAAMTDCFRAAAAAAGQAILDVRSRGFATQAKADLSPVTEADRRAEAIILARLVAAYPQIDYLAEESCAEGRNRCETGNGFFLVDPLDGTREFVAGRDEFTVNIAYVADGRPLVGVVYAPATGEMFAGSPAGAHYWATPDAAPMPIEARTAPAEGTVALVSRSHRTAATDAFLADTAPSRIIPMGSSLKLCRIAAGQADIYPCFGTTMEWDTAAAEAVLVAAGGSIATPDGRPLAYGKHEGAGREGLANPHFIARGRMPKTNESVSDNPAIG